MSLARASGQRTLLIEGDLRSPQMHKRFDIAHGIGLIDVLTGHCSAEEAIVSNLTRSFDVLPAGKLSANPHTLFGGEQFPELIAELKKKYRYIVLDTPPLLAASEALVLSKIADGALLCAMQDVSRTPQLRLAHQRLLASGTNVLGAVLNGVPVGQYLSLYGDYRYPPMSDVTGLVSTQRDSMAVDDAQQCEPPALCRPK
jgi:capsular exopolysaccharide synthesis family protein